MKALFSISFCLICFFCYSQPIVQRSNANQTVQDARLKAQLNLFLPIYADTNTANAGTNDGIDSSGGLIYTRNPYAIWYRKNRQWIQLADGGSVGDAWLITGNTPDAGSFVGTRAGAIDLVLRTQGLKMAEFLGDERIVRLGVLDTTIGGNTNFEIDDTDASESDLFTGLYKYSKLGQEWGGIYSTYMPPAQGKGFLYNGNGGFLSWVDIGTSGTKTGIDSITYYPPPPQLVTNVCYWINGASICYPLAGDSAKVINDTLFQYFNGDSIPYVVYGNEIFFGDTVVVSGNNFCSRNNGLDSCILIKNQGEYIDSIWVSDDSLSYIYGRRDGTELGSFSTLMRNVIGVGRIIARDTTNGIAIYWDSTGFSPGGSGWGLTGNAGTTFPTNFIGTTDANPFSIRVDNSLAGYIGTSGTNNTGLGLSSLNETLTGTENTAIGSTALSALTTGEDNTAVGYGALASSDVGTVNSALGYLSLSSATGGIQNTGIGASALQNLVNGSANVSVGYLTGVDIIDGNSNTLIGANTNTIGDLNGSTAIGSGALVGVTNGLVLGDTSYVNVGIGTAFPSIRLHVVGDGTTTAAFMNGNVGIGKSNPTERFEVNGSGALGVLFDSVTSITGRAGSFTLNDYTTGNDFMSVINNGELTLIGTQGATSDNILLIGGDGQSTIKSINSSVDAYLTRLTIGATDDIVNATFSNSNLVIANDGGYFKLPGYTVVTLPSSPVEGAVAYITDGDAGLAWDDVAVGGGARKLMVLYDGTNWRVR